MAGIDLQPDAMGIGRRSSNPLELLFLLGTHGVGKCPSVQLNRLCAKLLGGVDLTQVRLDEHADPDARRLEPLNGRN